MNECKCVCFDQISEIELVFRDRRLFIVRLYLVEFGGRSDKLRGWLKILQDFLITHALLRENLVWAVSTRKLISTNLILQSTLVLIHFQVLNRDVLMRLRCIQILFHTSATTKNQLSDRRRSSVSLFVWRLKLVHCLRFEVLGSPYSSLLLKLNSGP